MSLTFPDHTDVVFRFAPLTSVLCQIRFAPVLSLLDGAGVAGFFEAIRHEYGDLKNDSAADLEVSPGGARMKVTAPVWSVRDEDTQWEVSLAVDFVALTATRYTHFGDFYRRLADVLSALDRTVHPGRSKRVGLRKVNRFVVPDRETTDGWTEYLRPELLGLIGHQELPGFLMADHAEVHLGDGDAGVLSVRHGIDGTEAYRLDLDYWTERSFAVLPGEDLGGLLHSYAQSMTGFFHWCLTTRMYELLGPEPRPHGGTLG